MLQYMASKANEAMFVHLQDLTYSYSIKVAKKFTTDLSNLIHIQLSRN